MEQKKKVLAIVSQQSLYNKIEPILSRDAFDVSRSANATSSLILATNVGYDLIIAEYPLPDLSIVDFLGILQAPRLPSADSQILLLAKDDQVEGVNKHIEGDDRVQVVAQSATAEYLHSALAQSLKGVAARRASRLMVQFEARLGAGKLLRVCQTSNVSESGMLIHTSRMIPLETEMDVSFYLPGDPMPINGTVKVVRHTNPNKEELAGMGVQFTRIHGTGRDKIRDFVTGHWVAPDDVLTVLPDLAVDGL